MFIKYLEPIIAPFRSAKNKAMKARAVKGNIKMDVKRVKRFGDVAGQYYGPGQDFSELLFPALQDQFDPIVHGQISRRSDDQGQAMAAFQQILDQVLAYQTGCTGKQYVSIRVAASPDRRPLPSPSPGNMRSVRGLRLPGSIELRPSREIWRGSRLCGAVHRRVDSSAHHAAWRVRPRPAPFRGRPPLFLRASILAWKAFQSLLESSRTSPPHSTQ